MSTPVSVLAQGYHGGSLSARQHGYEHGYRDGYASGRNSRLSNRDQDIRNQQLRLQGNGYQPIFRYKLEYSEADSRNRAQSRLERLLPWQNPGFNPDRSRGDSSDGGNAGIQDRRAGHAYPAKQQATSRDGLHRYTGNQIAYEDGCHGGFGANR